jgi:hypothetical protein
VFSDNDKKKTVSGNPSSPNRTTTEGGGSSKAPSMKHPSLANTTTTNTKRAFKRSGGPLSPLAAAVSPLGRQMSAYGFTPTEQEGSNLIAMVISATIILLLSVALHYSWSFKQWISTKLYITFILLIGVLVIIFCQEFVLSSSDNNFDENSSVGGSSKHPSEKQYSSQEAITPQKRSSLQPRKSISKSLNNSFAASASNNNNNRPEEGEEGVETMSDSSSDAD